MFTEPTLTRTQRLLSAWVLLIQHNAVAVLVISVLLTLGTLYYSAANFKINTDMPNRVRAISSRRRMR